MFSRLFGRSKDKEEPAKKYEKQLEQLEKLGYRDRKQNLEKLEMYNGDANLVLMDYDIEKPSSNSLSPENEKAKATQNEPPRPAAAAASAAQQPKAPQSQSESQRQGQAQSQPKAQAKPKAQVQPKEQESKENVASKTETQSQTQSQSESQSESQGQGQRQGSRQGQGSEKIASESDLKEDYVVTNKPASRSEIELNKSLIELTAYDVKQIVYSLGSYVEIAEIFFGQSISGQSLYNFEYVQNILRQSKNEFGSEDEYNAFLQQLENQFKNKGILDKDSHLAPKSVKYISEADEREAKENQRFLRQKENARNDLENLSQFVASQVRTLILSQYPNDPVFEEIAERFYSYSIGGELLVTLDYNGALFMSGMNKSLFTPAIWDRMVQDLHIPHCDTPFDPASVKHLKNRQENISAKIDSTKEKADIVELNARFDKIDSSIDKLHKKISASAMQLKEAPSDAQIAALREKQVRQVKQAQDMSEKVSKLSNDLDSLEKNNIKSKKQKLGKRNEQPPRQAPKQAPKQGKQGARQGTKAHDLSSQVAANRKRAFEMQDIVDKASLPSDWYKLKQKQVNVINALQSIADSINMSSKLLDNIDTEAYLASKRALAKHDACGNGNGDGNGNDKLSKRQLKKLAKKQGKGGGKQKQEARGERGQGGQGGNVVTEKELEERQLRLLTSMGSLQNEIFGLGDALGVPISALEKLDENLLTMNKENVEKLDKSFANTFSQLVETGRKLGMKSEQLEACLKSNDDNSLNSLKANQENTIERINGMMNEAQRMAGSHGSSHGGSHSYRVSVDSDLKSVDSMATDSSHLNVRGRRPSMKKDYYPSDTESKDDEVSDLTALKPKSPAQVTTPLISVTNPEETLREAIDIKQRRKSLQAHVETLRGLLKEMDVSNEGKVDDTSFKIALTNVDIDANNKKYIEKIKSDVSKDDDSIDYKKFCDLANNPNLTLKFANHDSWDELRKELVGAERQEGKLRIVYRYDGWPVGQAFQVDSNDPKMKYIDTSKNVVDQSVIVSEINKERGTNIPFKEIRYAKIGATKADKVKWVKVGDNGNVPLRVAKDGYLEADVWLKTEAFMVTKQGIPFPH